MKYDGTITVGYQGPDGIHEHNLIVSGDDVGTVFRHTFDDAL